MGRRAHNVQHTILEKLQTLPAAKQAEVLDFVDYLASRTKGNEPGAAVYAYSAALLKRKRLKKLSLQKIAALVHDVRNGTYPPRGL
jgi:hypothetical protein